MTDKQLQKLNRRRLLEILVEQGKKIQELETQLEQSNTRLADRAIKTEEAGSIAQAALALTDIFEKAQQAADLYLENIKQKHTPAHSNEETNSQQLCETISKLYEQE